MMVAIMYNKGKLNIKAVQPTSSSSTKISREWQKCKVWLQRGYAPGSGKRQGQISIKVLNL